MTSPPLPLSRMSQLLTLLLALAIGIVTAAPAKRSIYSYRETTTNGDVLFDLGNNSYLANVQHPKVTAGDCSAARKTGLDLVPLTVIFACETVVTGPYLQNITASYLSGDDVFTEDFLAGIYIISTTGHPTVLDASALEFIAEANVNVLLLDTAFAQQRQNITGSFSTNFIEAPDSLALPAGPYLASISPTSIAFSSVYRLYVDSYRDFLFGAYDSNDGEGTFNPLGAFFANSWDTLIP
jgi:hypothetical protein